MELLIVAIVELVVLILILAITLTINVIALVLQVLALILEVGIRGYIESRKKKQVDTTPSETVEKNKRPKTLFHKIMVRGTVICSILLLLFLLAVVIGNAFFFESAMRFVLRQVEKRTSIAIAFDRAEGNFWTGKVQLNNMTIKRQNHPVSCFDLTSDRVELDVSMSKLLCWSVVFESVQISQFSGTWEQVGKNDKLKPRRNFRIDRLLMEDIQLDFTDRTREKEPLQVAIKLDTMESSPLRSNLSVFDILFRSRGRGSVNGIPFVVDSEKGKHFCRINDVPTELLAYYIGVFEWFDEGKVDLSIENTIGDDEMTMHWRLFFHDFHARIPEGTPLQVRVAALPLVAFMNLKSKQLPLEFNLQLREKEFHFQSSSELTDMARIILGDKMMDSLKKLKDRINKVDGEG